jgi:TPR repeat protein
MKPATRRARCLIGRGVVVFAVSAGAAVASAMTTQRSITSTLWTRPPPVLAAYRSERAGLAWIMRQLGASDRLIDALAGRHIAAAVGELQRHAMAGDPRAVNVLGEFAYQQCHLGRTPEELDQFAALARTNARRLPPADAAWFDATMQADVAYDKRIAAVCARMVNVDQVMARVEAQARAGNSASAWLTSRYVGRLAESQWWLRQAAMDGFPQAQFELAWAIIAHQSGAAGTGPNAVTTGAMLRASERALPDAQGELGICEFHGCSGVTVDPAAAIRDARDAAERGSLDAILSIGPKVQQRLLDPLEVSAWTVIQGSLEQQGCGTPGINLIWMNDIEKDLRGDHVTARAQALAQRDWNAYGAQIVANLGC